MRTAPRVMQAASSSKACLTVSSTSRSSLSPNTLCAKRGPVIYFRIYHSFEGSVYCIVYCSVYNNVYFKVSHSHGLVPICMRWSPRDAGGQQL